MNVGEMIFWLVLGLIVFVILNGCTTTPTCRDNPRNMQCMSAEQLERELNQ